MSWADVHLHDSLVRAAVAAGWASPLEVQRKAIPLALGGRDLLVSALTGSGKTGAFLLSLLERMVLRLDASGPSANYGTAAVVLSPTRELAVQTANVFSDLARFTPLRACLLVGGVAAQRQEAELRSSPDVVIATPGRLADVLRNMPGFSLDGVQVLVLDESDKLLQVGFQAEVQEILAHCPLSRQVLMFSATLDPALLSFAGLVLKRPLKLEIDPPKAISPAITQEFVRLDPAAGQGPEARDCCLIALLTLSFPSAKTLVFCNQKSTAKRLHLLLSQVLELPGVGCINGDQTQAARLEALENFRSGDYRVLVATDVASRGLDIAGIGLVIQYDFPRDLDGYVHRVGRCGRVSSIAVRGDAEGAAGADAGASSAGSRLEGRSISFITSSPRSGGPAAGIAAGTDGETGGEGGATSSASAIHNTEREILKALSSRRGSQPAAKLSQRTIDPAVLSSIGAALATQGAYTRLAELIDEQRFTEKLEIQELRVRKAENMLEHGAEIMSRPKKTWFQSTREKEALQALSRRVAQGEISHKDAMSSLSKEGRRHLNKLTQKEYAEKQRAEAKLPPATAFAVRQRKREERERRLNGENPGLAKIHAALERRRERRAKRSSRASKAAEEDDTARAWSQASEGRGRRQKRVGHNSFKSSKKYKRR